MTTVTHITPADGNVFADLGYPAAEAANLQKRAQLMIELTKELKAQFNTQKEAAEALTVSQARISDLYRGKIDKFTIDMLINMLVAVGRDVEVTVKEAA